MRQFAWAPLLHALVSKYPDVRLVVHASARQHSPADFLIQRLGTLGQLVLGVTAPRLARHASVLDWLAEHPEVEDWRVLDDCPTEFPPGWDRLIECDGKTGVSAPVVQQKLVAWLDTASPT
jgi:hypothetical protein